MIPNEEQDAPVKADRATKRAATESALKLLPKLIQSVQWNQSQKIDEACTEMAEILEPTHPQLSLKLKKLNASNLRPLPVARIPENLLSYEQPRHGFEGVVLPANVEAACRDIVAEHRRSDELAAFGLGPRHRVLLHGAPGNGKTMLAEALAKELEVPFLRVKYAGLIDSHLGVTGRNIDSVLTYAKTAPCVLFMDEIDGLGGDRQAGNDVGEQGRVLNQLLIQLEQMPPHSVIVAATNIPGMIDRALMRRFDFVIDLPPPDVNLAQRMAAIQLAPSMTPGHDVAHLASDVAQLRLSSMHKVVEISRRIRRDLALNHGRGIEQIMAQAAAEGKEVV